MRASHHRTCFAYVLAFAIALQAMLGAGLLARAQAGDRAAQAVLCFHDADVASQDSPIEPASLHGDCCVLCGVTSWTAPPPALQLRPSATSERHYFPVAVAQPAFTHLDQYRPGPRAPPTPA